MPSTTITKRLARLRDDHPDAVIETALVARRPRWIVRAEIMIPGTAERHRLRFETTAYGTSTEGVEAAENRAIGRALTSLGYGPRPAPSIAPRPSRRAGKGQLGLIRSLGADRGLDEVGLALTARERYGARLAGLSEEQAAALVADLRALPP